MSKKIVKNKKHDGLKIVVLLLVIAGCFYFIWQYIFVQNSKKSNAIDKTTNICCGKGQKDQCPNGYSCQGIPLLPNSIGGCSKTCQPKNYRRP